MKRYVTGLFLLLPLAACEPQGYRSADGETPAQQPRTQSYSVTSFALDDGEPKAMPNELPETFSAKELATAPFSEVHGDADIATSADGRILQSFSLSVLPAAGSLLPAEVVEFSTVGPAALDANGAVTTRLAVSSPSLREAAGKPLMTDAKLSFAIGAAGVMADAGVYELAMHLSPVTFPTGFAGMNIFFDLEPRATLTEYWPKLDDELRRRLGILIRAGELERALEELKKWLEGKGVNFDDFEIEVHGEGEGITVENTEGEITIFLGTGAFASVAKLYSALMHEVKHTRQHRMNPVPSGDERELEAWLQECENLENTGLKDDRTQLEKIRDRVREFYRKVRNATPPPKNIRAYYDRAVACLKRIDGHLGEAQ